MSKTEPWRSESACSASETAKHLPFEVWVNPGHKDAQKAKELCVVACPVREECLKDALKDTKAEGIRAGYSFESGAVSSEDAYMIQTEFKRKPRRIRESESGEV